MNPDISAELQNKGAAQLLANLASVAISKLMTSQPLNDSDHLALTRVRVAINKTQYRDLVDGELGP